MVQFWELSLKTYEVASTSEAIANDFNPAVRLHSNFYRRHIWKDLWANVIIPGDQIIAQKINTSGSVRVAFKGWQRTNRFKTEQLEWADDQDW